MWNSSRNNNERRRGRRGRRGHDNDRHGFRSLSQLLQQQQQPPQPQQQRPQQQRWQFGGGRQRHQPQQWEDQQQHNRRQRERSAGRSLNTRALALLHGRGRQQRSALQGRQDQSTEEKVPLALTSSSVSSSSYSTPNHRPRQADLDRTEKDEWDVFSEKVHMTPPHKITRTLSATIDIAEALLQEAGQEGNWNSLTKKQQAMMAFAVNADFHTFCPPDSNNIVQAVFRLGDYGEIWHESLYSFVHKGGDLVLANKLGSSHEDGGAAQYENHLKKYPLWSKESNNNSSTTVGGLAPVLRHQRADSHVCAIVTASILIRYSENCRSATNVVCGTSGEEIEVKLNIFVMNISRFMRTELDKETLYKYIFTSRGFSVMDIISKIMMPCNPGLKFTADFINSVELSKQVRDGDEEEIDRLYKQVQKVLTTHGPLFIEKFRLYDEYGSCDRCVSKGAKTYPSVTKYHALSIIGAARTRGENGGILFLVQDSDPGFPFKNVGLNLLLQMGSVRTLGYLQLNLKFPSGGVFDLDPSTIVATLSGSFYDDKLHEFQSWEALTADGGPLERQRYYMDPTYVPSWKRRDRRGNDNEES